MNQRSNERNANISGPSGMKGIEWHEWRKDLIEMLRLDCRAGTTITQSLMQSMISNHLAYSMKQNCRPACQQQQAEHLIDSCDHSVRLSVSRLLDSSDAKGREGYLLFIIMIISLRMMQALAT